MKAHNKSSGKWLREVLVKLFVPLWICEKPFTPCSIPERGKCCKVANELKYL
jgi:hypothetical protein